VAAKAACFFGKEHVVKNKCCIIKKQNKNTHSYWEYERVFMEVGEPMDPSTVTAVCALLTLVLAITKKDN
jgi:hypothetical protein